MRLRPHVTACRAAACCVGACFAASGVAALPSGTLMARTASPRPADTVFDDLLADPQSPPSPADPPFPAVPSTPTPRDARPAPSGDGASGLLREGTFLVDRTGRLDLVPPADPPDTTGGTSPVFRFESDGRAMADPPMRLLPNAHLMLLEDATAAGGPMTRFRVTGQITEYRGQNYLLLEKVIQASGR